MSISETVEVASVETKGNGKKPDLSQGYVAAIEITGTAPLLFHRYDDVAVEAKGKAAKNSAEKKSDNVESYVYRTSDKELGIPGTVFKASLREAGRSVQDPRSPRKSAVDLVKAAIQVEPFIASLGKKDWDYIDRRRVVVQRSAITRHRPALAEGWKLKFQIVVLAPEYVSPDWLHDLVTRAGRFVGIGDFRPDFGRFRLDRFEVKSL
jgi:hypothetical protein